VSEIFRVIIADDHELAREGLRAMIARDPGFVLVGEASSAEEAVSLTVSQSPDLAILDVQFGGASLDGFFAARAIRSKAPHVGVLMVTLHDAPQFVSAAVQAGARGYMLKDASRSELIAAMKSVASGATAFPSRLLVRALDQEPQSPDAGANRLARLTAREREVLRHVARGLTNKAIARELGLSPGTVKVHVERLLAKLGVTDRTQAAVMATASERSNAVP
jgi:DNA-binding NarL/FixJ family response regulator